LSHETAFVFRGRHALLFATLLIAMWLAPNAHGQQPALTNRANAVNASTPVKPPEPMPANGAYARLAQEQGKADSAVLDWVLANSGPVKGDMRAGELRIAFTVTPAEGWWDKAGSGQLTWHAAPAGNVHLRIFVVDASDGRLVPGLSLRATLVDANGNEQSAPADFGWYPLLNAYGGNVPIDADSDYALRVAVDPVLPQNRLSQDERLTHATIAEFPPVTISRDAILQLPVATSTAFNNEAELLKPCNAALSAAITALWQHSASGSEQPAGDYFAGYALDDSALVPPNLETKLHLRIHVSGKAEVRVVVFPRDSRTGRLIPGLKPQISITAANGAQFGPGELPTIWHPWFNHYGRSVRLPRDGTYKLHVHFDAPGFRRWGRQSERFASALDVDFDNVSLKEEAKN